MEENLMHLLLYVINYYICFSITLIFLNKINDQS
jgi:hypothetical protein